MGFECGREFWYQCFNWQFVATLMLWLALSATVGATAVKEVLGDTGPGGYIFLVVAAMTGVSGLVSSIAVRFAIMFVEALLGSPKLGLSSLTAALAMLLSYFIGRWWYRRSVDLKKEADE